MTWLVVGTFLWIFLRNDMVQVSFVRVLDEKDSAPEEDSVPARNSIGKRASARQHRSLLGDGPYWTLVPAMCWGPGGALKLRAWRPG